MTWGPEIGHSQALEPAQPMDSSQSRGPLVFTKPSDLLGSSNQDSEIPTEPLPTRTARLETLPAR